MSYSEATMLRFVLFRSLTYGAIGGAAALVGGMIRYGFGRRTVLEALTFAGIWAIGGGLVALYRGREK